MSLSLSLSDARKVILNQQGLYSRNSFGRGVAATLNAIEHLGYVQIDTLSVVARAHLHTLWNRVEGFEPDHLDGLQRECQVYEYWAHALSFLPMKDYRFSLPMMNRIASGETHWYPKDARRTKSVLKRIREEGPLSAKDFDDKKSSNAMWARAPSKLALEQLFMEGELMVPRRLNFHKIYDLRERVLPDCVDTRVPTEEDLCRHLIDNFLRAQGLGQIKETVYLRRGLGSSVRRVAFEMQEEGLITPVQIAGQEYFCHRSTLDLVDKKFPPCRLRILSPFDNAIIQRKRVSQLFEFDYQVECYVTKAKRKFGYFCLPVLRNNKLVARLDAKASRKDGVFHILHLHLEKSVGNVEAFFAALLPELKKFAAFDGCDSLKLHKLSGCERKPDWG